MEKKYDIYGLRSAPMGSQIDRNEEEYKLENTPGLHSSQYQSSLENKDSPGFETDDSPIKKIRRKSALIVQDKLNAIYNTLVVLMTICRDEEICYLQ